MMKYGAWKLECMGEIILAQNKRLNNIEIKLYSGNKTVEYEGIFFPDKATNLPQNPCCVMGMCIWGATWMAEFAGIKPSKAWLSFGLPAERQRIFQRLESASKGEDKRKIKKILLPTEMGEYHKKLLQWQKELVNEIGPQRILYHLPAEEYKGYIQKLKPFFPASARQEMLKELEGFAEYLKEEIKTSFNRDEGDSLVFVNPFEKGARDEIESLVFPYLYPHLWEVDPSTLVGVEDLAELRLSYEAQKMGSTPIPIYVSILGIPHPLMQKESMGNEKEILF